jgi:hypothetical protein
MLAAEPIEHSPRGPDAPGLDIGQSPLNTLDCLHAVEQRLIGIGILHHEFRAAVDGQDKRVAGLSQTLQKISRIPFEITQRSDVIGQI